MVTRILALLLFPSIALALVGTERGTGGNSTSEATTTIVCQNSCSNFTTGSTGVLAIAADNASTTNTNFPTTLSDSAGNTWYRRRTDPGGSTGSNNSVETAVYTALLTNGFTSTSTITMTYLLANVTAKAWTLTEFAPSTAGNIVMVKSNNSGFAAFSSSTLANSATPSAPAAFLAMIGDVTFAYGGAECTDIWTSIPSGGTNGTWSTAQHTGVGTTAPTNTMSIISQYIIQTTANSTQNSWNPQLTSAQDVHLTVILLTEVPPNARTVSGTATTSDSTTTIGITRPLTAGSLGVLCVAADNAVTGGTTQNLPSSVSDTQSNTWTLRKTAIQSGGGTNAGAEIGIYTASITTGLTPLTDTISLAYSGGASVTAKSFVVFEFSDATAYNTGDIGTTASSASPTVTTSSTVANGDYVVGMVGSEGVASTNIAYTPVSGWSSPVFLQQGNNGATSMLLFAQYKKVTATGTQTFNPTLNAASDLATAIVDLTAPPVSTSSLNGAFFNLWP